MATKAKIVYKKSFKSFFLLVILSSLIIFLAVFLLNNIVFQRYVKRDGVLQSESERGIIIDHTSVDSFDRIPEEYLQEARNLRVLFSDRSVGQNINESLGCLTASAWYLAPSACRRDYYNSNWNWKTYNQTDYNSGIVPARILFSPDPVKYSRANITFVFKGGDWSYLTQDFIQTLAPQYLSSKDVLGYQFSYLNVTEGDNIMNPDIGFWANSERYFDINDLENFISQHSDKTFMFWTTSLARGIGSQTATDFNDRMRQYARDNDKILFDVADIESYTDEGIPCYDNRDGVSYCSQTGACENHSDDGKDLPAICQDYTTETDGGHLGSVSTARIRIAKAFWVLLARISGWNPDGLTPPSPGFGSPTSTPTPWPTFGVSTPTPTSAPLPTPTSAPAASLHVGNLEGMVKLTTGGWQGRVEITVHNENHNAIPGVGVTGTFSGGWNGSRSCTTNNSGWCAMTSDKMSDSTTSISFSVNSISGSYDSGINHDIDGDTNGTSVVINR